MQKVTYKTPYIEEVFMSKKNEIEKDKSLIFLKQEKE